MKEIRTRCWQLCTAAIRYPTLAADGSADRTSPADASAKRRGSFKQRSGAMPQRGPWARSMAWAQLNPWVKEVTGSTMFKAGSLPLPQRRIKIRPWLPCSRDCGRCDCCPPAKGRRITLRGA